MNLNAHIFIERLHAPVASGSFTAFCPFHLDSGTKSLSVNLDKSIWYCHGGCDEPKGGGAIEFLIKWEHTLNKRTITRAEAGKMLRRTFAIPNAKTLRREFAEDELRLFAHVMRTAFANDLRSIERLLSRLHARSFTKADTWLWPILSECYAQRSFYEGAFDTCMTASRASTNELARLYKFANERGWWNPVAARSFAEQVALQTRYSFSRRRRIHAPGAEHRSTSPSESSCQEPLSRPQTTRTPVPMRQPVP